MVLCCGSLNSPKTFSTAQAGTSQKNGPISETFQTLTNWFRVSQLRNVGLGDELHLAQSLSSKSCAEGLWGLYPNWNNLAKVLSFFLLGVRKQS